MPLRYAVNRFIFCEVVPQLCFEKSAASAAFQVPLAAHSVSLIEISFVVNQFPGIAMRGGAALARLLLP